MGGSASKATRRLPTTTTSAKHAAPSWANTKPPPDPPSTTSTRSPTVEHGQMQRGQGMQRDEPRGRPIGKATADFSGEKDDVVRQDALDPHFASNLSRLGQVSIHDAGKFVQTQALAQRTLNSRRDEAQDALGSSPPSGHLTSDLLSSFLDELKVSESPKEVYAAYGVNPETAEILRRWVNSPSVGEIDTVRIEEGEEKREMKAVWVDGGR